MLSEQGQLAALPRSDCNKLALLAKHQEEAIKHRHRMGKTRSKRELEETLLRIKLRCPYSSAPLPGPRWWCASDRCTGISAATSQGEVVYSSTQLSYASRPRPSCGDGVQWSSCSTTGISSGITYCDDELDVDFDSIFNNTR